MSNRRRFISNVALATGAVGLQSALDPKRASAQPANIYDADFCVVGAGYAGLTAALRLRQAGRSVALLEARDRIGGRIWSEPLSDGTPIDISASVQEGHIVVAVADRGPGIVPGDEERAFERLYRGPNCRKGDGGLGLGLTLCRAIIAAHDGRIWLENGPTGGAIARFALPIRRSETTLWGSSKALAVGALR